MSNDVALDELHSLPAIRQFLPKSARTGRPVHPTVIARWITRGLKAADGSTVHLEGVKAGKGLHTSRGAVDRFFGELTRRSKLPAELPTSQAAPRESTSRRLASAGLK